MNKSFLKKAVKLSKDSFDQGKFPAGAVLVKDNKVVGVETSSAYPDQHLHAETKLIDKIMAEVGNQLEGYELYTSLAPCLMCFGKIYWSGIKRVYYVLDREDVDIELSYEGMYDFEKIVKKSNRKIEFIQDKTYYDKAMGIYQAWEKKMK